ncbi:MAG: hypothetical protein PVG07_16650, partial [Acidobacteriota bacterium]
MKRIAPVVLFILSGLLGALALPAEPAESAEPAEPTPAGDAPWFEDRAAAAGVDRPHRNRSFDNPYAHIMEGYTALGAA